jgi:hypothetical protein
VVEPGEHRGRGEHLDAGRGELDRERQIVEVTADLGDRLQIARIRLEVRANGARPFQEETDGVVTRKRLEGELLLAVRAQPCAARHGDLQTRAGSDDRRNRRRSVDDLLEVVENKQEAAVLDVRDKTFLEVPLAVEEPERPRDRADHVPGVPDRLKRDEDNAVRELVRDPRGDRVREARLPDPSGAGDGE